MKRPEEQEDDADCIMKKHKIGDTALDYDQAKQLALRKQLCSEMELALKEHRDFSFSTGDKMDMVAEYGLIPLADETPWAIYETNTPIAEPLNQHVNLDQNIKAVIKASDRLIEKQSAWGYQEGDKFISFETGEKLFFTDNSAMSKSLSTKLNGYERYHCKVKKGPTPAENWANFKVLRSRVLNNLTNPANVKNEALSRNRLRVGLMQMNGCQYPTAFPISIVRYILIEEAKRRPNGRLARYIDPCAGWGDRLAGALITGSGVVENYLGIDPWHVSNDLCRRIYEKIGPASASSPELGPVKVEIRSEVAQKGGWPDADLVFTGPPYAALECYNLDGPADDGQAWRLSDSGKFGSDFLYPLLKNAADATRRLRGRVIINMANTKKKDGGEFLTRDLVYLAGLAGLVHVDTYGMNLSVRMTSKHHGSDVKRGEPFFVFEHPE